MTEYEMLSELQTKLHEASEVYTAYLLSTDRQHPVPRHLEITAEALHKAWMRTARAKRRTPMEWSTP